MGYGSGSRQENGNHARNFKTGFYKGIGYTYIGSLKEEQRRGSWEIGKHKAAITSLGLKAPKGGGYATRTLEARRGGPPSQELLGWMVGGNVVPKGLWPEGEKIREQV